MSEHESLRRADRRRRPGGLDLRAGSCAAPVWTSLVVDRATFPRDKVCAGWITPQVVDALETRPATTTPQRPRRFSRSPDFAPASASAPRSRSYDRVVSYGIRRCEFDHYLLQRSGARVRLGDAAAIDGRGRRAWVVNGTIARRCVIGAGGHFCPVRASRRESRQGRARDRGAGNRIRDERRAGAACGVEHDRPELYFCDDLKGYGWCFRKGNFLNVGLGREGNHRLAEHVHAFSGWLQSQGKVPADAPSRFKGHAYLLYSHAKRPVVGDGVLIIGDAAGLAYAESGEGIRPAIESGLMAAQIIAAARGDYSKQRLSEYERQLAARFGERHTASLASSLPESWKLALARSLMQTQWFTRNVVINRWFLHADTAPLRA